MTERNIGLEILEGLQEIKAYKAGEITLETHHVSVLPTPQEIRQRLNLSQTVFAELMGVSLQTIEDWEHGRAVPTGPAKSLLRIADRHPNVFMELA